MAPNMRASDRDREEVATRLHVAAGEGRLEPDELEERLHLAFVARTQSDLSVLTQDLPAPISRAVARRSGPPYALNARRRQLAAYVVVNVLLVCLWMADVGARDPVLVGDSDFFWPVFSFLGWGGASGVSAWRERRRASWPPRPELCGPEANYGG